MPIYSNLSEYAQSIYSSYLSKRYEKLWHLYLEGARSEPVLSKSEVDALFTINVAEKFTGIPFPKGNTFEPTCDIRGPYISREILTILGRYYRLAGMKAYEDLKVAYRLFLYNRYMIDSLALLADTMYNAVQFHKEFVEAVIDYCNSKDGTSLKASDVDVSIEVNPENGICYKELMDYLHYDGLKPIILFKLKVGDMLIYGKIDKSNYSASFTETSYNIEINNIDFATSNGLRF